MPQHPPSFTPSSLTLGTVQLGLPYGIANTSGLPDLDQAGQIMSCAYQLGITTFDTARSYGLAEERIGHWRDAHQAAAVNVITKIPAIEGGTPAARRELVIANVEQSRAYLRLDELPLVLMHRANDLLDEAVHDVMVELISRNQLTAFGVSLYEPDVLRALLDHHCEIAAVQVPINVADQRYSFDSLLGELKARDIHVYARSAFLQGALLMPSSCLPTHLSALRPRLEALDRLVQSTDLNRSQVLLQYVHQIDAVDSVVVGVERADQLISHFEAIKAAKLPSALMAEIEDIFSDIPRELVDPSNWPN